MKLHLPPLLAALAVLVIMGCCLTFNGSFNYDTPDEHKNWSFDSTNPDGALATLTVEPTLPPTPQLLPGEHSSVGDYEQAVRTRIDNYIRYAGDLSKNYLYYELNWQYFYDTVWRSENENALNRIDVTLEDLVNLPPHPPEVSAADHHLLTAVTYLQDAYADYTSWLENESFEDLDLAFGGFATGHARLEAMRAELEKLHTGNVDWSKPLIDPWNLPDMPVIDDSIPDESG